MQLVTLLGLAISLAVPSSSQEQNKVDPEVRQEIETSLNNFGEAHNKHDAAALAALFTQDAVEVWDWKPEVVSSSAVQPSRKGTQANSHRIPANSLANLFRCMQSVTKCPLSRNSILGHGRAIKYGSMFETPMNGRSTWLTPLLDALCDFCFTPFPRLAGGTALRSCRVQGLL